MPTRPPTLTKLGVPDRRQADTRPAPSRRGYGRSWQRVRAWKLAHDPLCEDCLEDGIEVAAEQVDHVTSIAGGGTNEASNLRSLCASCHSKKTVRVDGGLGRPRGAIE